MAYVNLNYDSVVRIEKLWTDFKATAISAKALSVQYEEDANAYFIFAIDNDICYTCTIYKGSVPDPGSYAQATNNADKTDWTTNYQSSANAKTNESVSVSGTPTVNIGTSGSLALDSTLSGLSGKFGALGQHTMSGSTSVVIASDQGAIPITGSVGSIIVGYDGIYNRNILTDSTGILLANIASSSVINNGVITTTQNVAVNCQYAATLKFIISNTGVSAWTGTLVFESTVDNTTWLALSVINLATGLAVTSTTGNGSFAIVNNGYVSVRVRGNTVTANSATIVIDQIIGTQPVTVSGTASVAVVSALPTGANTIGAVTISGTPTVTVGSALPTGANTIGSVTISGTPTVTVGSALPTGANTIGAVTQSGTWTNRLTDGTNTAAIKAASSGAVATDTSLVVQVSPNQVAIPVSVGAGDVFATGSITNTQSVSIVSKGTSTVAISLTGTWTGTVIFEKTVDSTNWVTAYVALPSTGNIVTSTTTNGVFEWGSGGYQGFRVRGNTVATGTLTVSMNAGIGTSDIAISSPLPTGTNTIGAITHASIGVENATQPGSITLVGGSDSGNIARAIATDTSGRILVGSASSVSALSGFVYGSIGVTTTTATPLVAATYVEQTTGAQRRLVSTSTNDAAAGTGARTVVIVYYTSTGAGPNTTTVTLNGTTAVNTTPTDICFIERMYVATSGSTGSNVGTINLFTTPTSGGSVFAVISPTINTTQFCHHYISSSYSSYITGITCSGGSNNPASFYLKSFAIGTVFGTQITEFIRPVQSNQSLGFTLRTYGTPIKVVGPARLVMYGSSDVAATATFYGSFDYYDQ